MINRCLVGGIVPGELDTWPNCAIPDCQHKCCTWSGTLYCFPHAEELIGRAEIIRRFDATHEFPWSVTP